MKKLQKSGSFLRSLAAGLAVFACVSAAKAAPYASAIQVSGTNVTFILNEGGARVTVTYGDGTTNATFNGATPLPAGPQTFGVPGTNTTYSISCFKEGTGAPFQYSTNTGTWVGGWPATIRAVAVNACPTNGPSFGRVYVATTGSTATRQYGVYGITPDLQSNSFFGGNNINAIVTSLLTNTVTFSSAPANGQTYTVFGQTTTWTTNVITNSLTQVAVTNSAAAAATNMANQLIANLSAYPGLSVSVSGNVVSLAQPNLLVAVSSSYAAIALTGAGGPFGPAILSGNGGFGSGPYRMYVAPDGGVYVTDAEDAGANCYYFSNNFQITNNVFSITGRVAAQNANQHGNINDIAIQGSAAAGNLQIWTADNGLFVPGYFGNTNDPHFPGAFSPNGPYGLGQGGIGTQNFGAQETEVGDANEIYRYDLYGTGYPTTNTPNFAATTMLGGGFEDSQVMAVALNPINTNYVYAMARRDNGSDGSIQVFSQSTGARLYTSLHGNVNGAFNTASGYYDLFVTEGVIGGTANGPYGGVRISPDGHYLCAYHDNQVFMVCNLTNGIPDESSMQILTVTGSSTTGRHFGWDAADNLYSADSDLSCIHVWDLGITATSVTANDLTGTNGTFQLILPSANSTVVNNGNASQNYGSFSNGFFQVGIGVANTNPVTLAVTIGGSATNGVNYTIPTGSVGSVTVVSNSSTSYHITFPAGTVTANIPVTPTASPAVGPTLTVTLTVTPGTNYITGSPGAATVSIANTGAQYVFVSAALTTTTMSRSISNDYAEFVINRWGDTNGPSNSVGNISPASYTVTNFALTGTAVFGTDYVAGPQRLVAGAVPIIGSPGVQINPGDVAITCLVGDPVPHTNLLIHTLTNNTVIVGVPSPGTAQNGTTYTGSGSTATMTETDNRVGAETVLWSDPLTNSAANTYTVTFASTNLNGGSNTLPVVIPNYLYTNGGANNGSGATLGSPSNAFDVELGFPVATEGTFEANAGVGFFGPPYNPPVSPVMAANGWSNCLRVTVDKSSAAPTISGVNVYPTTNQFFGNYALRFDMYLSIWSGALNNVAPLNYPRQFAAFGINHQGTNANWRLSVSQQVPISGICNPTNADGIWFVIDAGDGSLTPADYDAFASPPVPNQGTSDFVSSAGANEAGVFKKPPFAATDGDVDGAPINQWVSVSVETTGTNIITYVDGSPVIGTGSSSGAIGFTNFATSFPSDWSGGSNVNNGAGLWTNGVPMLGYIQPYNYASDESAFVYYSNVRIVELAPTILIHPYLTSVLTNTLVYPGSNFTFSATASYSQPGLTNIWYAGTTAPTVPLSTNSTVGTNLTSTLNLTNVLAGSNYWAVFSDSAGSITSYVQSIEVVTPLVPNQSVAAGAKATFTLTATGQAGPTYQWYTNGVALVNGTKYTNATTAALSISNVATADTIPTYTCVITTIQSNIVDTYYVVTTTQTLTNIPPATLSIIPAPSGAVVSPASQTNLWGSSATFSVSVSGGTGPFTYGWLRGATKLTGATKYAGTNAVSLTISNLTQADAGAYSVNVTNAGGTTTSTTGALVVTVPPPTFTTGGVSVSGGNVTMTFGSTNSFDNTNAFKLLSSPVVTGPYTNTTAVFSGANPAFQVTVPESGTSSNMFYELLHAN